MRHLLPLAARLASITATKPARPTATTRPETASRARSPTASSSHSWNWHPMAASKDLDLSKLDDADPRATAALARMRKAWDAAPLNPALDDATIRIPGFLVMLDGAPDAIQEFLRVPYFGACIHVPPPPANQVIHVRPNRPVKGVCSMDPVWVSGVLKVVRPDTPMGKTSYRMKAASVVPYKK